MSRFVMRACLLALAEVAAAGCTIQLHVSLAPDDVERLRAALTTKEAVVTPAPSRAVCAGAAADTLVGKSCPIDQARTAYVSGDYLGALQQALQSNHTGWHVVGAAACALQDPEWVMRAVANLTLPERKWLRDLCERRGVTLQYLDSDHPRAWRDNLKSAGRLDEDED